MPAGEQSKTKQAEARVETPAAKPATAEVPKVDAKYSRGVMQYFSDLREDMKVDPEIVEYLTQAQKELHPLTQGENVEKLSRHPENCGMALGELAGNMHINAPFEERLTGDPKQDAENEKRYLEAKKLFMESCAKVFPTTRGDISELRTVLHTLGGSEFAPFDADGGAREIAPEILKLSRENPREAARKLDEIIDQMGSGMKGMAWGTYKEEDSATQAKFREKLAFAGETAYNLQLMRDKLQQQIYGRSDVTPSEARKIDTIREKFQPKPLEGEKTKAPETKEMDPALKAAKEKASRAASYLQERGVKVRLNELRLENDVDRWKQVADGLDKIRSDFLKDRDSAFKKGPKYQPEVDKLFESVKK